MILTLIIPSISSFKIFYQMKGWVVSIFEELFLKLSDGLIRLTDTEINHLVGQIPLKFSFSHAMVKLKVR